MLFNLTCGCFSLFIEIPRDSENSSHSEFLNLPFPEIPFYTSTEGVGDLSQNDGSTELVHSITLTFGKAEECTDAVEMHTENGRSRFFSTKNSDLKNLFSFAEKNLDKFHLKKQS